MKILALVQGTPEWERHRATRWNASDAPAMLGVSSLVTRRELLAAIASGLPREFSDYVEKKIIAPGHRNESLARELAEQIIGDDLYPVIGVPDDADSKLSASFDGLTLDEATAWEHKRMNQALREALSRGGCIGADLPEMYRVQLEQQALVSGASRVLFMASEWDGNGNMIEELHCWYTPDPALRARILAGWAQFARDLADYRPEPAAAAAAVGRAPETLPSLRVEAQGMVTFSNLAEFRANAMTVLGGINRELQTDEDFADAETTVKWCKGVEDRLEAAKSNVLAQMQSVDEVCRTIDSVSAETRKVRLELDRLVKAEKEHRRAEIVAAGVAAVRAHYNGINATLAEHQFGAPGTLTADIGASIKGRKTLTSIRDAVDTAVAAAKIEASQYADRVRQCVAVLDEFADHAHLFADRVPLCASKSPDDLRNLAAARIAEHAKRETERLEAERARIRAEEAARIERERQAAAQQPNTPKGDDARAAAEPAMKPANPVPDQAGAARMPAGARIKLGEINAAIAPLSVSAAGLAQIGFAPVGHDGAAKLYAAGDLPAICDVLIGVLQRALLAQKAA